MYKIFFIINRNIIHCIYTLLFIEKIYQSKEDLPEGILELLQKDPAFDFDEFSEMMWAPKGKRWTDHGSSEYG